MSWIKPNFLWIVYLSGRTTKPEQKVVLAIWLKRIAMNPILTRAISAKFFSKLYFKTQKWQQSLKNSPVRLPCDRYFTQRSSRLAKRLIQLRLRNNVLAAFARNWILNTENISKLVREQYKLVESDRFNNFLIPARAVFCVVNVTTHCNLQLSIF